MKRIRAALAYLLAVAFGVYSAFIESLQPWDFVSIVLLSALIAGWLLLSHAILRFVDARNRTHKFIGFVGFIGLLVALFATEWLAWQLKRSFSPDATYHTSFRDDTAWLVLFPILFYYVGSRKRANKAPEPTPMSGTSPAGQEPRRP